MPLIFKLFSANVYIENTEIKMLKLSKKSILIIVPLLVLGAAGATYSYVRSADPTKPSIAENEPANTNDINYDPPTEEEQAAGDKRKEEIAKEEQARQESQNQTDKKEVAVIITDAGQYDDIIEVRSFVPNHYQDGTCSITFSKNSQTIVKKVPARKDVSTTICMNPLVKRTEFPGAGSWQVKVSYDASGAKGASETRTINIK